MGNKKSTPASEITGDKNIAIINTQEVHTNYHEDHELKLNIILILVAIQLTIVIYKAWQKRLKTKAYRKARNSIATISQV